MNTNADPAVLISLKLKKQLKTFSLSCAQPETLAPHRGDPWRAAGLVSGLRTHLQLFIFSQEEICSVVIWLYISLWDVRLSESKITFFCLLHFNKLFFLVLFKIAIHNMTHRGQDLTTVVVF